MTQQFKHWHLETDSENILWLGLDREGQSVNSLSREVFDELSTIIEKISQTPPTGVVIFSAKEKGFIAGADISQFTHLKNPDEAFDLIRQAQIVLDKLAALPIPTVAMIHGFCLGGGTEVALACRYRVASDDASTRIGLPEVKLGIHPGWGGTVRLPPLVGAIEAMKIMLPGADVSAKNAYRIGMVDVAVPHRELKRAARYYVVEHPAPHKPNWLARLSNSALLRPLMAKIFYKQLASKHVNKDHYPAPYAIVECWEKDDSENEAMLREAKSIAHLMLTPTARNLVRVFFLQERMKGLAKGFPFKPKHVHVIGAGTMGGDIAAWCAYKGLYVTLQDQTPQQIAPAIERAYKLFKEKLKEPRLIQAAMDRLQPDAAGRGVARADVVIEAVFENLTVKQKIFRELEPKLKPEAILATNTSSIPLEEIAQALKNPARLVGIHFFNPVAKMMLIEIVSGQQTDPDVAKAAAAFVTKIGRLPLPVTSHPGFLINRILMPYLMEAMQLFEEGVPPEVIDKAALQFGMPMGPITLADKVGLDIGLSVAENLTKHYGGTIPERLKEMVKEGRLGVKTGQGFYTYHKGKKVKQTSVTTGHIIPSDMIDRLILRMLNEAVLCLHEKIVSDADLLDAGMIFGTGFAPFRGGPIKYAETRGIDEVVAALQRLYQHYGERFKPHEVAWAQLKKSINSDVINHVEISVSDSHSERVVRSSGTESPRTHRE